MTTEAKFVAFLEATLVSIKNRDSSEGSIAYKWSTEPGEYIVDALVRVRKSHEQGWSVFIRDATPMPDNHL